MTKLRDPLQIAEAMRKKCRREPNLIRATVGCLYRYAETYGDVDAGRDVLTNVFPNLPMRLQRAVAHDVLGSRPRMLPAQRSRTQRIALNIAMVLNREAAKHDAEPTDEDLQHADLLDALRLGEAMMAAPDERLGTWLFNQRRHLPAAAARAHKLLKVGTVGGSGNGQSDDDAPEFFQLPSRSMNRTKTDWHL